MNQQGANAIKWEVGKTYKTRCGYRAVFRSIRNEGGQNPLFGLDVYFLDNETVDIVWIDPKTGLSLTVGKGPLDIIGPWEEPQETATQAGERQFATWDPDGAVKAKYENPNFSFCVKCTRSQLILAPNDCYICAGCGYRLIDLSVLVDGQMEDKDKLVSQPADADLYDYKNVPAKSERTVKARYVPSDYARAHLRDINTPDDRRPRVDLRTAAQIAHERAVLRLRQHKLARWGMAESVDWEGE